MTSKDCSILINGHQLCEALSFLAPDNTEEQLDQEVIISTGGAECHSGPGLYCWLDEYPEEGAIKLDGTSPAALSAPPAAGVPDSAYARRIIEAGEKLYNELRQWLATESDPDSQAALQEWREICAFTPPASEQQRAVGLDVIDKLRIELRPEYEAGYTAVAYVDSDQPVAWADGMTAREAIAELLRLNPHLAKGEGV